MKRIVSLALVLVLVLCMVPITSSADESNLGMRTLGSGETYQDMTISSKMIYMIMDMEGFYATPYRDNTQLSIGYGSCYSKDMTVDTTGVSWTQEEAEARLISDLHGTYGNEVNQFCKKIGKQPTQQQFDALVAFTYNVGGSWMSSSRLSRWLKNPTTLDEFINAWGTWSRSSGSVNYGLCSRRVREAIVFLYGEYYLQNGRVVGAVSGVNTDLSVVSNHSLPYFKFVIFKANGGSFESNVTSYSNCVYFYAKGSSGIVPYNVTRDGYDLNGWTITRVSNASTTKGEAFTTGTVLNQNLEITAQWSAKPVAGCTHDYKSTTTWNKVVGSDGNAVCDSSGYVKYTVDAAMTCANCGEVHKVQGVEAQVDTASSYAATCTENGAVVYSAAIVITDGNGAVVGSFTDGMELLVSAKGHNSVADAAVNATCTTAGLTAGSHCSTCGTVLTAQTAVSAAGHSYSGGVCTSCGAKDPSADTTPETEPSNSTQETTGKETSSSTNTGSGSKNETSGSTNTTSGSKNETSGSTNTTSGSKNETSGSTNTTSGNKNQTSSSTNKTSGSKNETSSSTDKSSSKTETTTPTEDTKSSEDETTVPEEETTAPQDEDDLDGETEQNADQGVTEVTPRFCNIRYGEQVASDFAGINYLPASLFWNNSSTSINFRIRLGWQEIIGNCGYQIWRQNDDGSWILVETLGEKSSLLYSNLSATSVFSNADESYTYKMRVFQIAEDCSKVYGTFFDEFTVSANCEVPVLTAACSNVAGETICSDAANKANDYPIRMKNSATGELGIVDSILDCTVSCAIDEQDIDQNVGSRFMLALKLIADRT